MKWYLNYETIFLGLLFAVVVNLKEYASTDESYVCMIGDWIDLILASVPNAVIMVVPTFMDLCNLKEIKTKCIHILKMLEKTKSDIIESKQNEESTLLSKKGCTKQSKMELPFLPTSFLLKDEDDEETKVGFLFIW